MRVQRMYREDLPALSRLKYPEHNIYRSDWYNCYWDVNYMPGIYHMAGIGDYYHV